MSVEDSEFPVHATNGIETVEHFRIDEARPAGTDAVLFVLYGEVDLHVAPEVRDRLDAAVQGGTRKVVVDLSRVSFVDSMALGVLLGTLKRLRAEGGELRLVVPSSQLRRIFEITLLDEVFELTDTRQEALAAFASSWGV